MRILTIFNLIVLLLFTSDREKIPVGGQAVIEGVLMKGPHGWALAVREPSCKIWTHSWPESTWLKRGIWQLPIIRGFATMVEMMRIGMKALSMSAEISLGEEDNISNLEMFLSVAFAISAVILLFIALPMFLSEYITAYFTLSHLSKNILEGVFRGIVFVSYILVISLWKDMRRVFEYHGAEHKTINAYESNAEMNPVDIQRYSRIHRRCGTSFLLIVIFVSIIVFSSISFLSISMKILSRVILLPLIIGISYEFIKYAANSNGLGAICMKPALLLQYITTKEPSEDQIEIALTALNLALVTNKNKEENI
ncbi:MAG: DUF1385 domain-containing protein [Synergistaceae bacterium]